MIMMTMSVIGLSWMSGKNKGKVVHPIFAHLMMSKSVLELFLNLSLEDPALEISVADC